MRSTNSALELLFAAALEIDDPAARSVYLAEVCAGDEALLEQVVTLVEAHRRAGDFMEVPAGLPRAAHPGRSGGPGAIIGPYKLLEPIGEGGMGDVYLAEQSHPVRRRVALKVIKPGMDTRQVITRFEAERQALALMDHPNIARVLDGGSTADGRPYFVMELVRGIPITDYCDREQLSLRERLDLFVLVCRAVQHAHQKGIIHRDLKPSNVLVTIIDGVAVPKVIDFGVAKAIGGRLTEKTLFTGFHQFVGTPLYMSPEQADLSGVDVDTRSDIYSLGVLLYELLTGTTPFDQEAFRKAAFDEVRRMVREDEPPRPSIRLSSLGETRETVSANRRADARQLRRAVRGELDWIVMKALGKDRGRRYETANDFAADVMSFSMDRPVAACPPSALYRLGKLARRNRAAVATAVLVSAVSLGGTAVSLWQAGKAKAAQRQAEARGRQATAAARLARRAADDLYDQMIHTLDIWGGSWVSLPGPFLKRVRGYYERFAAEPVSDPATSLAVSTACRRLGDIRKQMGLWDEAEAAWRRGVALLQDLLITLPGNPDVVRELAMCHFGLGEVGADMDEKLRALALREELALRFPDVPEYRRELGQSRFSVALWHFLDRRYDEAIAVYHQALEVQEPLGTGPEASPDDRRALGQTLRDLANAIRDAGRPGEAELHYQRALQIHEALVAATPGHPVLRLNLAWDDWEYGRLLAATRRPDEALERQERAVSLFEGLVPEHPQLARWLGEALARRCLLRAGFGQADAITEALARADRMSNPEVIVWVVRTASGESVPAEGGDPATAAALVRAAATQLAESGSASKRPGRLNAMAWALSLPGKCPVDPALAVATALHAVELSPHQWTYWNTLGLAYYRAGEWDRAIEALGRAVQLRGDAGSGPADEQATLYPLAMAHARRGDAAEARTCYDRALRSRRGHPDAAALRAEAAGLLKLDSSRGTKAAASDM